MEGDCDVGTIRETMKNWLEDYNDRAGKHYTVSAYSLQVKRKI